MSLIIKGMDMPKDYKPRSCTLHIFTDDSVFLDVYDFDSDAQKYSCKSYPLVEVPTPHGDLIDRDAFLNDVDRVTYIDNYDYDSIHELCHDRANAAEVIIEAMEE